MKTQQEVPSYFCVVLLGPLSCCFFKGYTTAKKSNSFQHAFRSPGRVYVYLIFRGISMLTTRNRGKNMFLHNFSAFFRVLPESETSPKKVSQPIRPGIRHFLDRFEKLLHFNSNSGTFFSRSLRDDKFIFISSRFRGV